jgi:uncharacterized protein YbaR (Trm112 family)
MQNLVRKKKSKLLFNIPNLSATNTLLYRWLGVLRCPQCRGHLDMSERHFASALCCADCSAHYAVTNAIPRLVAFDRVEKIEAFGAKYDALRLQEGWASELPEYYLRLPFQDLSGRHAREWQMRAKSFRFVQKWLEQNCRKASLRILDAGAGTGWMSRLLAERHEVLAVDVNAGPHGLSAAPMSSRRFMAVQAELARLPLASKAFDVAIANASLHYTRRPESFLKAQPHLGSQRQIDRHGFADLSNT